MVENPSGRICFVIVIKDASVDGPLMRQKAKNISIQMRKNNFVAAEGNPNDRRKKKIFSLR